MLARTYTKTEELKFSHLDIANVSIIPLQPAGGAPCSLPQDVLAKNIFGHPGELSVLCQMHQISAEPGWLGEKNPF